MRSVQCVRAHVCAVCVYVCMLCVVCVYVCMLCVLCVRVSVCVGW